MLCIQVAKKEFSKHLKYRQNISSKQNEPKFETKTELNRFSFSNQTNVGRDQLLCLNYSVFHKNVFTLWFDRRWPRTTGEFVSFTIRFDLIEFFKNVYENLK